MVKAGKWLRSLLGGKKDSISLSKENSIKDRKAIEPKKPPKEKRRWSFGRSKARSAEVATENVRPPSRDTNSASSVTEREQEQNKHAMAVAAATAAAAEAAVAAAQAAAVVVRLTSNGRSLYHGGSNREEWAAVKIQTAFRGYLARRALRALKGLVKLQALVRGHIVRKQAAITLRCMQALVRVQARIRARRVRMSEEGQAVQRQLIQRRQLENRPRRSMERWNPNSATVQELDAKVSSKQMGAMKRDRAMANAFSQQLRKVPPKQNSLVIDCEPDKPHWGWTWLDRWMAARPWESPFFDEFMNGIDGERNLEECAKIVEMDTGRPRPGMKKRTGSMSEAGSVEPSMASTPSGAVNHIYASPFLTSRSPAAPLAEAASHGQQSMQESPAGSQSMASPVSDGMAAATMHELSSHGGFLRGEEEESVLSTAQSSPRYGSTVGGGGKRSGFGTPRDDYVLEDLYYGYTGFPNYMATTQSSKAKVRSQSAPKQRPDPLDKASVAASKKRLSLHDVKTSSIPARMQRSSSQVRVTNKVFAGPIRLDRSTMSLKDSETSSINGDFRRPFK